MIEGARLLGLSSAGFLAGAVGAVLGIGGSVFLVPVLVLFFRLPMTAAVGTGLVSVIANSSAVAGGNVGRGIANMRLGIVLELATVAGALGGAFLAGLISPRVLMSIFGLAAGVVSALLWRGRGAPEETLAAEAPGADDIPQGAEERLPHDAGPGSLGARYFDRAAGRSISYEVRRLPLGLGVSFAAGGLSGMLGVGGGVFKVPALHLFCNVPMRAAAATSNFMIGVTAAGSAFLYWGRGDVEPLATSAVILGTLAGSVVGAALSDRLRESALRRAFAFLLALLSLRMVLEGLRGA